MHRPTRRSTVIGVDVVPAALGTLPAYSWFRFARADLRRRRRRSEGVQAVLELGERDGRRRVFARDRGGARGRLSIVASSIGN